jgi:hypothetical protein
LPVLPLPPGDDHQQDGLGCHLLALSRLRRGLEPRPALDAGTDAAPALVTLRLSRPACSVPAAAPTLY